MAGGEFGNKRHIAAERQRRVVELRDQDLGFREIAAELGIAVSTAWKLYQRAMRLIPAAAVAAHAERAAQRLEEQLARIDMEREEVMSILTGRHVMVSNGQVVREDGEPVLDDALALAAIDRLIKLDAQEADLLGLKAEKRVNLTGGVRYEVVGVAASDLT